MVFLTRRMLLMSGVSVGALSVVGFGVSGLQPADQMRVLTQEELSIVEAIADAMFPEYEALISGKDAGVPAEIDRILAEVFEAPAAIAFRAVLRSLEWGSYASRWKRFSRLSVEQRREVLDVWGTPGILPRQVAAVSLKAVFGMAYFGNRTVKAAMGWRALCGGDSL